MGVFNKKARLVLSVIILFSLICVFFLFGFNIVFASDYNEDLNLEIKESTQYNWVLQNPGELTSVRLSGFISSGSAKAYVKNNNKTYLIFSFNNTDGTNFEICEKTCNLTGFDKESYNIIFEVDNVTLTINKIIYSVKDGTIEENITIEENQTNETETNFTLPIINETINETIEQTTNESFELPIEEITEETNETFSINDTIEGEVVEELSAEILNKLKAELKDKIKEKPKDTLSIIIKLSDTNKKPIKDKIKLKKGEVKESLVDNLIMADLAAEDLDEIAEFENVEEIWPDRETKIVLDQSVNQINAPYLWDLGYTGKDIKVAILDTGVSEHDMLQNRIILQEDFTGNDNPLDNNGHGTHVAGIVAGSNESGQYNGVAPEVLILNGKVLNAGGSGQLSWLINGIEWAINNGADIISLSLGATYDGNPEDLLTAPEVLKVEEAISKGIIVVIASGNCNTGCGSFTGVTTPGIARNAITVGAVDNNNIHADFSSGGIISDYIKPDVVAPGVGICSSFINNDYSCLSGTSMSTPHVAGSVALLLEKDSLLSPLQIKSIFESNALDLGVFGKDIEYGSGLIDLSKLEEPVIPEPKPLNYVLDIPMFLVNKKDTIVLHYNNTLEDYKKFKFVFNLEDLDDLNTKEFKKTIKYGKVKDIEYKWKSSLVGKHLLTIDVYTNKGVYVQHIEAVVAVAGGYTDNMANVKILVRDK